MAHMIPCNNTMPCCHHVICARFVLMCHHASYGPANQNNNRNMLLGKQAVYNWLVSITLYRIQSLPCWPANQNNNRNRLDLPEDPLLMLDMAWQDSLFPNCNHAQLHIIKIYMWTFRVCKSWILYLSVRPCVTLSTAWSSVHTYVTGNCKPPPMAGSPVRIWKLACIADQNCYRL